MRTIKVEDAVGHVLHHDITRIIPNVVKDTPFRKGHVIKEKDIEKLKSLGKENIYVYEKKEGMLHENEAAHRILKAVSNDVDFSYTEVREGKINFISKVDGLLKIDINLLEKINSIGKIIFSTIHDNIPVKKGEVIASTRVIPLVIDEKQIRELESITRGKTLLKIKKYRTYKVGIVTTGTEIYNGRIKDAFGPILRKKLKEYGHFEINQKIVWDDRKVIQDEIENFINDGYNLILCTGGMSVDPDDLTPSAIKSLGGKLVTYGAPSLPGAMLLVAYLENIPVLGLPGCVMYSKRTSFDLVLPKILAGERISKEYIIKLGHSGLCRDCKICTFPNCGFGK
jgi:molybdenum cofactor synthesis domain-containing protein